MKRLVIRLSSLGDLILAHSVLQPPYQGETQWLVAHEYVELLQGNPRISRVWSFDRKQNGRLTDWIRLLFILKAENFDEVLDLHSTLRTRVAKIFFLIFSSRTNWKSVSKERFRRWGYILFKIKWPHSMRPRHFSKKCAVMGGGKGSEVPDLSWLITAPQSEKACNTRRRIGLAPASAWPGKEWPNSNYIKFVKSQQSAFPNDEWILLGTLKDSAAVRLRNDLVRAQIPFRDHLEKGSLKSLASELAACTLVIGADTGLLHFAEAVGTPVITIYGPTRADFGFGPLRSESVPLETPLWCSPCSKDGSLCFRRVRRYHCFSKNTVEDLFEKFQIFFSHQKFKGSSVTQTQKNGNQEKA